MRFYLWLILLFSVLFFQCETQKEQTLAAFDVFCEMVASEAKPMALGRPMTPESMEEIWDRYQGVADQYGVLLYREKEFPVTPLFPASVTEGMEVVVIYRDPRLVQYEQLKSDLGRISGEEAGRRLGRLLGYSPQGINELLMKNTNYRTLTSFGVEQQITHLYYEKVEEAHSFYQEILGLSFEEGVGFRIGIDASIQLHPVDEQHPARQPKSTAIAFLTDQLPQWYAHVQEQGVPIKYTYKPRDGGPHDGFVAIDPGGYLLEFEEFKQHPENELFMAALADAPWLSATEDGPAFYGSITWTYHNDLLKMQQFYEEVLGYRLVADQGWTKIYQTSPTGFIGLVDERRGMMDYADVKAVEVEWRLAQRDEAHDYYATFALWNGETNSLVGPEKYFYRLR